jgi:hypothetical protein
VDNLYEWGRFYTRYVSEIESDPVGDFTRTRAVFKVKKRNPEPKNTFRWKIAHRGEVGPLG